MFQLLYIFSFDMSKFILKSFYFLLFFGVFYTFGVFVLGSFLPTELRPNLKHSNGMYGTTYNMLRDAEATKNVDILVIGASDAYRGYDPRIFKEYGIDVFNMGSSSQTPKQTELLLDKYLTDINPKLILYEVSPVCMTLDGVESTLDLMVNEFDQELTAKLVFNNPDILLFNSFLYSVIKNNLTPGFKKSKVFNSPEESYISRGFVETKMKFNKLMKIDSLVWKPSGAQLKKFDKVLAIAQKHGKKVLLVNANSITDRFFSNSKSIDSFFNSKTDFIDMNANITLNDTTDYFDNSHLNSKGLRSMNSFFIPKILIEKYKLK